MIPIKDAISCSEPAPDGFENDGTIVFDFAGYEGLYRLEALPDGNLFRVVMPTGKFIYGNKNSLSDERGVIAELEDGCILGWLRKIFGITNSVATNESKYQQLEKVRTFEYENISGDQYKVSITESGLMFVDGPQGNTKHSFYYSAEKDGYILNLYLQKLCLWQLKTNEYEYICGIGNPFNTEHYLRLGISSIEILKWLKDKFTENLQGNKGVVLFKDDELKTEIKIIDKAPQMVGAPITIAGYGVKIRRFDYFTKSGEQIQIRFNEAKERISIIGEGLSVNSPIGKILDGSAPILNELDDDLVCWMYDVIRQVTRVDEQIGHSDTHGSRYTYNGRNGQYTFYYTPENESMMLLLPPLLIAGDSEEFCDLEFLDLLERGQLRDFLRTVQVRKIEPEMFLTPD